MLKNPTYFTIFTTLLEPMSSKQSSIFGFSFSLRFFCISLLIGESKTVHKLPHPVKRELYSEKTPLEDASLATGDCDQSLIPVLDSFDIEKFSGDWYELAKSPSGYLDLKDGMWRITWSKTSVRFLFSGRNSQDYCIQPISGIISTSDEPPGLLTLYYRTYSTSVNEKIRILHIDYAALAIIYTCLKIEDNGACHPGGAFVSIWTRIPHVDVTVFNNAITFIKRNLCVDIHRIRIISRVGPCKDVNATRSGNSNIVPDKCYQDLNRGSCSDDMQRFLYDRETKSCQNFSFTGCGGNDNKFLTLKQCEKSCTGVLTRMPRCLEASDCAIHCPACCRKVNGCVVCDCQNIILDDFAKCDSIEHCPIECALKERHAGCFHCDCDDQSLETFSPPGMCKEIKEPGHCDMNCASVCEEKKGQVVKRFYFDLFANQCLAFDYTGCGGNKNNFENVEECDKLCRGITHPSTVVNRASELRSHIVLIAVTSLTLPFL